MSGQARDIEVRIWDGSEESQAEIVTWSGGAITGWFDNEYYLEVETPSGTKRIDVGDLIFREVTLTLSREQAAGLLTNCEHARSWTAINKVCGEAAFLAALDTLRAALHEGGEAE